MATNDSLLEEFERHKNMHIPSKEEGDDTVPEHMPGKLHEKEEISLLKETRLQLESRIEALLCCDFEPLPDNDEIKLKLAEERLDIAGYESKRTLDLYKKELKRLADEERKMDYHIKCAIAIKTKQEQLIKSKTEEIVIKSLRRKHEETAAILKFLKPEVNRFIESRYPNDKMLDTIRKFYASIKEPGSTGYVSIEEFDFGERSCVETLITDQIVMVHPKDPTQVKMLAPEHMD